jgi:eukaryotic translation initiation factor 2C
MDSFEQDGNSTTDGGSTQDAFPPPPPVIPPDVVPLHAEPEPLGAWIVVYFRLRLRNFL